MSQKMGQVWKIHDLFPSVIVVHVSVKKLSPETKKGQLTARIRTRKDRRLKHILRTHKETLYQARLSSASLVKALLTASCSSVRPSVASRSKARVRKSIMMLLSAISSPLYTTYGICAVDLEKVTLSTNLKRTKNNK